MFPILFYYFLCIYLLSLLPLAHFIYFIIPLSYFSSFHTLVPLTGTSLALLIFRFKFLADFVHHCLTHTTPDTFKSQLVHLRSCLLLPSAMSIKSPWPPSKPPKLHHKPHHKLHHTRRHKLHHTRRRNSVIPVAAPPLMASPTRTIVVVTRSVGTTLIIKIISVLSAKAGGATLDKSSD